jgi:hypothetical protein
MLNLPLILCWFCYLALLLIFFSSDQYTALHEVAFSGNPAACELLIASKADVDAKDGCASMF